MKQIDAMSEVERAIPLNIIHLTTSKVEILKSPLQDSLSQEAR